MSNFNKLHGKRIVVVGGSSGIGFAVAQGSLAAGASVVIASSNKAKVDGALERLNGTANVPAGATAEGKVLDAFGAEAALKDFFESVGKFDHLVWTVAPSLILSPLASFDPTNVQQAFTAPALAPMLAAKHALAHLPASAASSITFTSGTILRRPQKGWALMAAMGGAVDALGRALAVECAPVRVNVVGPGSVETEMWDGMPPEQRTAFREMVEGRLLVKHVATPDEAAETYLYAMKCSFITGETLYVDGGNVIS